MSNENFKIWNEHKMLELAPSSTGEYGRGWWYQIFYFSCSHLLQLNSPLYQEQSMNSHCSELELHSDTILLTHGFL